MIFNIFTASGFLEEYTEILKKFNFKYKEETEGSHFGEVTLNSLEDLKDLSLEVESKGDNGLIIKFKNDPNRSLDESNIDPEIMIYNDYIE